MAWQGELEGQSHLRPPTRTQRPEGQGCPRLQELPGRAASLHTGPPHLQTTEGHQAQTSPAEWPQTRPCDEGQSQARQETHPATNTTGCNEGHSEEEEGSVIAL